MRVYRVKSLAARTCKLNSRSSAHCTLFQCNFARRQSFQWAIIDDRFVFKISAQLAWFVGMLYNNKQTFLFNAKFAPICSVQIPLYRDRPIDHRPRDRLDGFEGRWWLICSSSSWSSMVLERQESLACCSMASLVQLEKCMMLPEKFIAFSMKRFIYLSWQFSMQFQGQFWCLYVTIDNIQTNRQTHKQENENT